MHEELARHRVPRSLLEEFHTGPVSERAIAVLRAGQLSRRKLQLRTLLDLVEGAAAEEIARAWQVLSAAERRNPVVTDELLLHPSVGVWLTRTLRKVSGGLADSTPFWAELGYFSSVAAAAAIRTGTPCTLTVPVVHGVTTLPTVGQLRLPTAFPIGTAELRAGPRRAVLRSGNPAVSVDFTARSATSGFTPARRIVAGPPPWTLTVEVDDHGPYREFSAPVPPRLLDSVEQAEWAKLLGEAFDILATRHPAYAAEISLGVTTLVPLDAGAPVSGASASSAFGAVAACPKASATELAEVLVHELQHSKLNALFDLVSFHDRDIPQRWFYAPWRDDPRPVPGILHGIFAFCSAVEFWRYQRRHGSAEEGRLADFHYALRHRQVRQAIDVLSPGAGLNDLGREFVDSVDRRLAAAGSDEVPGDIAEVVTKLTVEHRASWLLHHVRPDTAAVTALADAWLTGTAPGAPTDVPGSIVPCCRSVRPAARVGLLQAGLSGQPGSRANPTRQPADDLAYACGDTETAVAGYRARIVTNPQDDQAWLGLGLAMATRPGHEDNVLVRAPHVALAVRDRILAQRRTAVPATEFAEWLGAAVRVPTGIS